MKTLAALFLCLYCLPGIAFAGVFNLAAFTCDSYENQIEDIGEFSNVRVLRDCLPSLSARGQQRSSTAARASDYS